MLHLSRVLRNKLHAMLLRLRLCNGMNLIENLNERERVVAHGKLPALQLVHVQHVVYQRQQVVGRLPNFIAAILELFQVFQV